MKEEQLKEMLKEKGKSIRNASIELGLSPTTLQNVLERGIENTTVKTIKLISNYLNITSDEIIFDCEEQKGTELKSMLYNETLNKLENASNNDLIYISNTFKFIEETKKSILIRKEKENI